MVKHVIDLRKSEDYLLTHSMLKFVGLGNMQHIKLGLT